MYAVVWDGRHADIGLSFSGITAGGGLAFGQTIKNRGFSAFRKPDNAYIYAHLFSSLILLGILPMRIKFHFTLYSE
jgi:hypothetical protein